MSQEQQLTPQQALANLYQASQEYRGTKKDHDVLSESVQILVNALNQLTELSKQLAELTQKADEQAKDSSQ